MSFHVPEPSRDTTHPILGTTSAAENNGLFLIESCEPGWRLALICSDGGGWEHVSVHAFKDGGRQRTPAWKEMCQVKRLCWDSEDEVVQFHPRESEYVNCHQHMLHLWRPTESVIQMPPAMMVGPR